MKNVKTWDEWKRIGRCVVQGSRMVGKNKKGEACFHIDQTTLPYKVRRALFDFTDDSIAEFETQEHGTESAFYAMFGDD